MKNVSLAVLAFSLMLLSSCQVIGGIFKAGFAVGIIAVILVIVIIFWIISQFRGR